MAKSEYAFMIGVVLFFAGLFLTINDAEDFPEIINPSHGFPHHWITGVVMLAIGMIIMISITRSEK